MAGIQYLLTEAKLLVYTAASHSGVPGIPAKYGKSSLKSPMVDVPNRSNLLEQIRSEEAIP